MTKKFQKELTPGRLAALSDKELAALSDKEIVVSDIPELGEKFWTNAQVVMPQDRGKTQITAKFDA